MSPTTQPATSIVLPTFNEMGSIDLAIDRLHEQLSGQDYEIIVVDDDSPDGTWRHVEARAANDPRLRVYRRTRGRGLATAILDGLAQGMGQRLLVMDADLQHDAADVPQLLQTLDEADLAIGSRYVAGGDTSDWNRWRLGLSRVATRLSKWSLGRQVTDPMSGFFALRRELLHRHLPTLRPHGYKFLLHLVHAARDARIQEVPIQFAARSHGESKMTPRIWVALMRSLTELSLQRILAQRFVRYCLVGGSGAVVQIAAVWCLQHLLGLQDKPDLALAIAIGIAMGNNYLWNNLWTFADRPHRTWPQRLRGLSLFVAISGIGALINHAVTSQLADFFAVDIAWTSIAGIAVATCWNFIFNWGVTWSFWRKRMFEIPEQE